VRAFGARGRRALSCALRGGAPRRPYDARLVAFGFLASITEMRLRLTILATI
jgi:hypothetical protein